jgi:hypothetical protein
MPTRDDIRGERVSSGRWQVKGVTCACGGELVIDRCGTGAFRCETSCTDCYRCDPNGWPTVRQCLAHLDYFGGEAP